jgi:3-oxoacyl-[acyl-carrier-protein] synthase II
MKVVEARMTSKARGQPSVGLATPRVAIRGWRVTTVFGDAGQTWDALLAGRCINDHSRVEGLDGPWRAKHLVALKPLLMQPLDHDAAVVVGTSKGSVEGWLDGYVYPSGLADIAVACSTLPQLRGPRLTVSAACASGLIALVRGAMLIQSREARQVVVVATEASVHPLFLGSFERLGVLARPGEGCRPFDRNRSGFYMSEAGVAVLLEAEAGDGPGAPGSLYVDRYALGGDATHLTGGDPHLRTLRHLLARVIDGGPVDLVHAHGTGTEANDVAELAAIESAMTDQRHPPALYSHKGALGHSLGAAGLLSVVLNCQAHATGVIPPNAQTLDPLPAARVSISRDPVRRGVRRSLAIAAGFGGATAVVSLVSA